jgi:hypothetical protein
MGCRKQNIPRSEGVREEVREPKDGGRIGGSPERVTAYGLLNMRAKLIKVFSAPT